MQIQNISSKIILEEIFCICILFMLLYEHILNIYKKNMAFNTPATMADNIGKAQLNVSRAEQNIKESKFSLTYNKDKWAPTKKALEAFKVKSAQEKWEWSNDIIFRAEDLLWRIETIEQTEKKHYAERDKNVGETKKKTASLKVDVWLASSWDTMAHMYGIEDAVKTEAEYSLDEKWEKLDATTWAERLTVKDLRNNLPSELTSALAEIKGSRLQANLDYVITKHISKLSKEITDWSHPKVDEVLAQMKNFSKEIFWVVQTLLKDPKEKEDIKKFIIALWVADENSVDTVLKEIAWKDLRNLDTLFDWLSSNLDTNEKQSNTMPRLATDLPVWWASEIQKNWSKINSSSVDKPYVAETWREYIKNEKGIFYNSRPQEKNTWWKIDESGTFYIKEWNKLWKGIKFGSGLKMEGTNDIFSGEWHKLEKRWTIFVEKVGDIEHYYVEENWWMQECDAWWKTEKQFRSEILTQLKKINKEITYLRFDTFHWVTFSKYEIRMYWKNYVIEWGGKTSFWKEIGVTPEFGGAKMSWEKFAKYLSQKTHTLIEWITLNEDINREWDINSINYFNKMQKLHSLSSGSLESQINKEDLLNNLVWFYVWNSEKITDVSQINSYIQELDWLDLRDAPISDTLMRAYIQQWNREKAQDYASKYLAIANKNNDIDFVKNTKEAIRILSL